ncbi:phosphatidylinositol-glycan biosynthesis class F protein-like [Diadema antillarum]|uniref:phosphatidylinositol-glycan biosynthesis class F protein-like n=1 Tax=Diadema antillarum TaxID=105358 RepID=UPI003A8A4BD3
MAASSLSMSSERTSRKYVKSIFYVLIVFSLFHLVSVLIVLVPTGNSLLILDPISTLKPWCILYGVLQCIGSWHLSRSHPRDDADCGLSSSGGKNLKGPRAIMHFVTSTIKTTLKYGLLLCFSFILFHTVAVLYGAPLTESVQETAIFAVLLTTLVALPTFFMIGTDGEQFNRIFKSRKLQAGIETALVYIVVASLLGAWLGAFPIPLDWDRPWQKWPISCCIGALIGHAVGLGAAVVHCGRMLSTEVDMSSDRKSKNF